MSSPRMPTQPVSPRRVSMVGAGWHSPITPPAPHHPIPSIPCPSSCPYADTSAVEVKSLDLLAALPTPPHNQTEDVR